MKFKNTRAFITGGAGFIGSRLAVSLKKAGVEVSCYDNFLPQVHLGNTDTRRILKDAGVEVIVGDVRDADSLSLAVSRATPQIVERQIRLGKAVFRDFIHTPSVSPQTQIL